MFKTFTTLLTSAVIASSPSAQPTQAAKPLLDITPYAVTMSVPNIEVAAQWYDEILGFKVESTKSYPEYKTRLAFLRRENFRIELIEDANAKPGPMRADAPAHTAVHGVSQFMFETQDIAQVKTQLKIKQVPMHFEFENAELGIKIVFIRDPNANLITFVQRLR